MLSGTIGGSLGLLDDRLKFLDLALQKLVTVAEGSDLLLLLKVVLLELLDSLLEILGLRSVLIRLDAERVHLLHDLSLCTGRHGGVFAEGSVSVWDAEGRMQFRGMNAMNARERSGREVKCLNAFAQTEVVVQ